MLIVMAEKRVILNLRLSPEVRDQFSIAAKLRGASMSGLLHQFIVRTIRDEKNESPQSFKSLEAAITGTPLAKRSARGMLKKIDKNTTQAKRKAQ